MSFRSLAFVLALSAAMLAAAPDFAAGPVFPPGLRVGLEPPGDLRPSYRFPGFEDRDRSVAVAILDLPAAAFPELNRALQSDDQKGLVDVKRETFPLPWGAGTLLTARGQINDQKLHKWVLLAAAIDKDLTLMINVEVPDAATTVYSDAVIRKALASAVVRPAPIDEQLGLLPFKLSELAGFRVNKVLPAGGVIITEGPNDDIGDLPYMIVSVGSGSPEQPNDRVNFARDLLLSSPLRNLSLQQGDTMRIGGMPGYEIRGEAKSPTDKLLSVVQWVRFGTGGFMRIVGVGAKDNWDSLFTRFRAVRDGIESQQR